MDDLMYGTRNKRGDWSPSQPVEYAPLFALPPRIGAIVVDADPSRSEQWWEALE